MCDLARLTLEGKISHFEKEKSDLLKGLRTLKDKNNDYAKEHEILIQAYSDIIYTLKKALVEAKHIDKY